MSGFGSLADIRHQLGDVRFTPIADIRRLCGRCPLCAISRHRRLLNHLVGASASTLSRDTDAERLSGLEIEHGFELGRLHHRQVEGFSPLRMLIDIAGGAPVLLDKISAHRRSGRRWRQSRGRRRLGQLVARRKRDDQVGD